ncbi:Hypothetical Protein RRSL_01822 [Ralstonia solanacearum UW551]|uniref:Uncharacterized protein n=1 Tax=Ralstonia solanacearum (strain UW551) TaxID=342110 RepID=A0AB33VB63_RALSU|nr:Hypothetical Protein RRSL_01822 [Ralstonia solanacearum UW551]
MKRFRWRGKAGRRSVLRQLSGEGVATPWRVGRADVAWPSLCSGVGVRRGRGT